MRVRTTIRVEVHDATEEEFEAVIHTHKMAAGEPTSDTEVYQAGAFTRRVVRWDNMELPMMPGAQTTIILTHYK